MYASVSYVIEGPKDTLEYMEMLINKSMERNSNTWIGNIIYEIYPDPRGMVGDLNRSYLNSVLLNTSRPEVTLDLETEERFGRTMFSLYLAKAFPGIKIYYREVMPQHGVLKTNDEEGKYFPERYRVAYKVGDEEGVEYVKTEEEALDIAYKLTDIGFTELLEVECWNNDQTYDKGTDDYIYINEFLISD